MGVFLQGIKSIPPGCHMLAAGRRGSSLYIVYGSDWTHTDILSTRANEKESGQVCGEHAQGGLEVSVCCCIVEATGILYQRKCWEPGVLGSRVCLAPGTLSDLPQELAFSHPPFLWLSWNANASNAGKLRFIWRSCKCWDTYSSLFLKRVKK